MIVVDSSVLVTALADDTDMGDQFRSRLRTEDLLAPEVIDLEIVSALRKLEHLGQLTRRRSTSALADLDDLPLRRIPHRALLTRIWQLRGHVTPYDAAYVALAERLDVPLLTADRRLAAAPGIRCQVEPIG